MLSTEKKYMSKKMKVEELRLLIYFLSRLLFMTAFVFAIVGLTNIDLPTICNYAGLIDDSANPISYNQFIKAFDFQTTLPLLSTALGLGMGGVVVDILYKSLEYIKDEL